MSVACVQFSLPPVHTMPEEAPKKKKERKPPPPCPPGVSYGYVVLRSLVSGLVSVQSVGPFQPTFLKDKEETGKFVLTCESLEHVEIDTMKATLESLATEFAHSIVCGTFPDSSEGLPAEALDDSFKKPKPGPHSLVRVGDALSFVAPSVPCQKAKLELTQCEFKHLKKATQLQLSYRTTVVDETLVLDEAPPTATSAGTWKLPQAELFVPAKEEAAPIEETAVDAAESEQEMVVTAWEVSGKIDYTKLVNQFGSTLITDELLQRLQAQSSIGLHRFLRRGIFFSHRDMHTLLLRLEQGTPFYLYTGRGPSSQSMHLGHLIPFLFTKWLQEAFDVPLVIQMTDDEKFLFKGSYEEGTGDNLAHYQQLTMENARDIIACGFDYEKTFLFSDLDYVGTMYPNIVRIWKAVTTNTVSGIFGFDGSANIGKVAFPAIQAAPSFASSFPTVLNADRNSDHMCLIPCAIDQDPYFRMTRDIAHKLVHREHPLGGKPALIHSKFFPPLQGAEGKMSSSDNNSAIFLTDTPEDIERKIKEHAFSGGRQTKKEQEMYGADLDVDVSYQWLRFFLEDDDELEKIGESYGSGKGDFWSTSLVKKRLIEVLKELVAEHQERRAKITDEEVRKWMAQRSIL